MTAEAVTHPFDFGQGMDSVLDGVSGNDVRVVSSQIVFAWFERDLHVSLQLNNVVVAPMSLDEHHPHCILAVARPHKLHILHEWNNLKRSSKPDMLFETSNFHA